MIRLIHRFRMKRRFHHSNRNQSVKYLNLINYYLRFFYVNSIINGFIRTYLQ